MNPAAVLDTVHAAAPVLAAAASPPPGPTGFEGITPGGPLIAIGAVIGLVLLGLFGLFAGSGRSGMATTAAARRLIGEAGLRGAAGQLRPSLLEHTGPGHDGAGHQQAVPGPPAPGRERARQKSAPADAEGQRS